MAKYANPVLKKKKHKITSPYGMRTIFGTKQFHKGVDFVGKNSTLDYIIACEAGVVTISKNSTTAGEYVQIDHGNGIFTRYLHMRSGSRKVKVGDKVKKGQVLGYMGSTGNSTGAHLHFDITVNGEYVNPIPYLEGTKHIVKPKVKANKNVKAWQKAAKKDGYKTDTDGIWDKGCEKLAKEAICKNRSPKFDDKNLTKLIQKAVRVKANGKFGDGTENAVKKYQKKKKLTADGVVGLATWKAILGVK